MERIRHRLLWRQEKNRQHQLPWRAENTSSWNSGLYWYIRLRSRQFIMPNLNKRYLLVSSWDTEERILRTPPKRSKFLEKMWSSCLHIIFFGEKFSWKTRKLYMATSHFYRELGKVQESCWCWRLEQGCWICGSHLVAWWNFPSFSFSTALVPNKYSLVIVLRFFPPCSSLELMPRRLLHLHICRKTLQYLSRYMKVFGWYASWTDWLVRGIHWWSAQPALLAEPRPIQRPNQSKSTHHTTNFISLWFQIASFHFN